MGRRSKIGGVGFVGSACPERSMEMVLSVVTVVAVREWAPEREEWDEAAGEGPCAGAGGGWWVEEGAPP